MSSSRRVLSTVTDTLTSDVVTTSTGVLKRSNTSKSRRRKPWAISIRVDVMSMTVTPRLQASAVSCRRRSAAVGRDQRAGDVRPARVQDADRDVLRHRRQNRARMQHLRAEVRQLRRFGERQLRHEPRGRARRADRRSACRPRRSRSESRRRRGRRRRSPPSSPTRRGRAWSSRRSAVAPMKPPSTGDLRRRVLWRRRARCVRCAGGVHVGHRGGVLGVGDEHLLAHRPRRAGILAGGERRRHDPAAGQLAHRHNRVVRPRRHFARLPQARARVARSARRTLRRAGHERRSCVAVHERGGDADVPLAAVRCSSVAASSPRPSPARRPVSISRSVTFDMRRHDDDRRRVAGLRLELLADDADDAAHRLRIGDRGAAELHDDVHSSPSRCISSAFRIAAPAAPRIVLCPSATNL